MCFVNCQPEQTAHGLRVLDESTTTTATTVLRPPRLCPGLPGWAGTRKVKPIWIYWSKR